MNHSEGSASSSTQNTIKTNTHTHQRRVQRNRSVVKLTVCALLIFLTSHCWSPVNVSREMAPSELPQARMSPKSYGPQQTEFTAKIHHLLIYHKTHSYDCPGDGDKEIKYAEKKLDTGRSHRPDDSCPVYSYILSQDPFSSFQTMTLRS